MYCLPALINYLIVALMHFTNTITLGSVEYVLNKWYVDMSLHISIIYDWNVNRTYPLKTLSILLTLHLGWHFKSNLIPESCFYFILFLLPGLFFQQIVKQNNKKIIKILYIYIYILILIFFLRFIIFWIVYSWQWKNLCFLNLWILFTPIANFCLT